MSVCSVNEGKVSGEKTKGKYAQTYFIKLEIGLISI